MKVLFVLPSFHANLHGVCRSLIARGVEVVLLVEKPGQGSLPGPRREVLGPSGLLLRQARAWLRREDPDLIVIRRARALSRPICLAGLERRAMMAYDLRPLNRPVPPWLLPLRAAFGRPLHRMTPVRGLPWPGDAAASPGLSCLPDVAREEIPALEVEEAPDASP